MHVRCIGFAAVDDNISTPCKQPDALHVVAPQLLAECKCGSPTMLSSPDIIKAAQFIKQHHADSYRCLVDAGMGDADCCIAAVKQNTKVILGLGLDKQL